VGWQLMLADWLLKHSWVVPILMIIWYAFGFFVSYRIIIPLVGKHREKQLEKYLKRVDIWNVPTEDR